MSRKLTQPKKLDLQLMEAVRKQALDLVHELLAAGANVNATDFGFKSALFQAAATGNLDLIQLLLSQGADPNILEGGKTPLMEAAYRGHREAVDILLTAGANLYSKLEIHKGCFMDVAQFAMEGSHLDLCTYIRGLKNKRAFSSPR